MMYYESPFAITDNLGSFLTIALAAMSITSLAGLGLVQGTVTALRSRVDDLTKENKDLKEKRVEDQAQIKQLKTDMDALARVVTHEVHWETLTQRLEDHHKDSEEHWGKMEKLAIETQAALYSFMRQQDNRDTRTDDGGK